MILRQINFCSVLRYKCITMIWTIHSVFHFRPYIFVPIILLVSLSWHVTFLLNSNNEVLFSKQSNWYSILIIFALFFNGGRRCLGHDRMVVGFTTTYAITTRYSIMCQMLSVNCSCSPGSLVSSTIKTDPSHHDITEI